VHEGGPGREAEGRKKPRAKDVFGRTLPTEEEFPALKDAPKLETGVTGRVKPFAIEIRNVKCARCGAFGHQSGDRECSLKDVIMPNEEERLKRNDPLTVIMAQASDEVCSLKLQLSLEIFHCYLQKSRQQQSACLVIVYAALE
jgi:hypothetical protein